MIFLNFIQLLVVTFSLTQQVNAKGYKKYHNEEHMYTGCSTAISSAALFCPKKSSTTSAKFLTSNVLENAVSKKSKTSMSACVCSKEYGLASLVKCNYLHAGEYNPLSDELIVKACKKLNVTLKAADLHDAYTKYSEEDYVKIYENKTYNATTDVITKPILVSPKKYTAIYLSNKVRYDNITYGYVYGIGLVAYFAGVLVIAALHNWARFMFPSAYNTFNNKFFNLWRKHVTLAPTFKSKHLQPLTFLKQPLGLIPTRLESLVILGYFILHVVFLSIHYQHVEDNVTFTTKQNEISRYVGDRSALILCFTTPLAILFAGKNNFLVWFTGIKQETFMAFHRWTARILTAVLVIHTGGFVSQSKVLGKLHSRLQADYFRWGIVGFAFALALCFHAAWQFRSRFYETFLLFHLLFGFFFIFGAWRHAASQGYAAWYYAAAACWIFDRVVSGFRVLAFGFPISTVKLIANETLKVTIKKPRYWKPFPGAYAYVYFFTPTSFWQSHPFTILEAAEDKNEITFHIKTKKGVTSAIAKKLRHLANNQMKIRVSVEGPYGVPVPMKKYERAVFFSSGNGIPGPYFYATDLAKKVTANSQKTIRFYWVVRYYESLEWMYEELLKLKDLNIETVIYVTRPNATMNQVINDHQHYSEEKMETTKEKDDSSTASNIGEVEKNLEMFDLKKLLEKLSFIEFVKGRPNIEELVKKEIGSAKKSVAFMSCGHASMIDTLRVSVANNLSNRVRVEYFEENQQW